MEAAVINSPIGKLQITGDENGIASVIFLEENQMLTETIPQCLEDAVIQLEEYFLRKRKTFALELNPSGTDFQKTVWQELLKIPYGKTTNYLQMAKNLGDPKVIRAAASANGKNPISIIIPCHRVIGSDGSLTGYAGGLWRKKALLELELEHQQTKLF